MGAVGGAGPCAGGGEGVLALCGTMALVGTVVMVCGSGQSTHGTRDGEVRCGAPMGSVACGGRLRRGVVVMQLVGVAVVLGHPGAGIRGGRGRCDGVAGAMSPGPA